MNSPDRVRRAILTGLAAALLASPALAHKYGFTPATVVQSAAWQDPQESAQERRDREQEARDREQEKRDREQEKKDREQERLDRIQEMLDDGREALDDGKYARAEERFSNVIRENGSQVDVAMYWKAYAQYEEGKREAALTTIAELKKNYPQSKWKKDAEALEIEVRTRSGQTVDVNRQGDDDLKVLALQGLMNSDPARGIQAAGNILKGAGTPKQKSKVLFIVAQNGSTEARDFLAKVAQGRS